MIKLIKKIIKFLIYYPQYVVLKLSGEPDEIITIIDGGLGSQMSQYAMGQEIQRITGINVSYDLSWYENNGKDINGIENRLYEIEKIFLNITVRKASKNKCKIYETLFNKKKNDVHVQNLDEIFSLSPSPPMYLGGYYNTLKFAEYCMDNLRKSFSFNLSLNDKNKEMLENILREEISIAVQIRLGDYNDTSGYISALPQYFHKAINNIVKIINSNKIHFFIFSTDAVTCKEILNVLPYNFTYIDINDNDHGANDMYLMSHCHHFIISNSTFGIWPALLSDRSINKIVIYSNKWFNTTSITERPIYPGWILLDY